MVLVLTEEGVVVLVLTEEGVVVLVLTEEGVVVLVQGELPVKLVQQGAFRIRSDSVSPRHRRRQPPRRQAEIEGAKPYDCPTRNGC